MNQDQINELIRVSQENAWAGRTLLDLEIFFIGHFVLFTVVGLCYAVFWLFLINDNLKTETGVDRLTWLVLLLALPLFGALFYLRRLLEREAAELPPGSKPGWKHTIE